MTAPPIESCLYRTAAAGNLYHSLTRFTPVEKGKAHAFTYASSLKGGVGTGRFGGAAGGQWRNTSGHVATQTIVASLAPGTQQQGGTCTLLDLTIQPIDLDLLGLHLHTDTIHLVLTAQRGTLLGDLLCGLFFGNAGGAASRLEQATAFS